MKKLYKAKTTANFFAFNKPMTNRFNLSGVKKPVIHYLTALFVLFLFILSPSIGNGQTTISQWTYEPLQGVATNPTPNIGSGSSGLVGSMTGAGTATGMTGTGCGAQTSGTLAWAISTAAPGTSNESSGAQFNVSTLGYNNIIVRWDQRWSNTATNTVRLQYTTDGSTWTNFEMTALNTTFCLGSLNNGRFEANNTGDQYRRTTVDLSSITGVNNNASFGFRVVAAHYQATGQFRQTATPANVATGGTWRFDNVTVSGTIVGGNPTVNLSVNPASASEAGATAVTVIATASAPVSGDQTVSLGITGTGITTGDYTLSNSVITILNGTNTGSVTFTVVDDLDVEGPETATLTISNPSPGITLGTSTENVTIADNEAGVVITKIHTIQGNNTTQLPNISGSGAHNDRSPLEGQTVTVEGIVTAVYNDLNAFFLQEEDGDVDADPSTSEGIFVFTGIDPTVVLGQKVQVRGAVDEFFGMTQIDNDNANLLFTLISSGNPLPTAATIDLPIAPGQDINDFYEQYEAMRVNFVDKLVVSEYFEVARYGQIVLTENSRPFQYSHTDNTPTSAEYTAFQNNLARRTIILDDENNIQNAPLGFSSPNNVFFYPRPGGFGVGSQGNNFYRGGDAINNLTGVLHWSFAGFTGTDAWRIRPTQTPITFTVENTRPATPASVGGNIKVASFNVLNYFTSIDNGGLISGPAGNLQEGRGADSPGELTQQTQKLVQALEGINADVFGLVELENNSGNAGANGGAIAGVVNALNTEVGSGTYSYVNTGNVGTDAIAVGFIYKSAVVSPVGTAILNTPAFTDPNNTGQQRNRPAVAVTFEVIDNTNPDFGAKFTVVVNHLKSKGAGGQTGLDVDQLDGQANWNDTRAKAALALAAWLSTDPTGSNDPDFLIIGDLNAYKGETPITNLINAGFNDLSAAFGGSNAYSYVFDGQLGYLDHALANNTLLPQVTGTIEWHINADEVPVFDYNNYIDDGAGEDDFEAKPSGNNLFEANAFRTSDHDPVIIGLDLGATVVIPTVTLAVSTNSASEGGANTITVTANTSSPVTGNQTVTLSVSGTSVTGGDYALSNTTITIPNGLTAGSVTFTVVDDILLEGTETAVLTISNPSAGITLGATTTQNITITDNEADINLCNYVRIGRYDLPEPTRTTPPVNSLLAQEVSGVTYNWDTQTLFVVGDGGTSVVQVSKTGQLINSMTLAPGGSPQNTEFYDPEGITYIGNGKFVMTEERDRNAVLFTYVAGGTLTRANAQTVPLGTFVQNIGLEGVSYDPLTNGYIFVKETQPLGIFQTGIDFDAGTATNGSATTVNSIDLFNPALAGLADFADVFALSNLPALSTSGNLLVLSHESGKIVNIDRSGNISSSLTIVSDPGNPLTVAAQQHEGLTMDSDGILYVVSENGGGDFDHPQLWVYAPSSVANQAPTAITLSNTVTSIAENTSTTSRIKVADINVADDGLTCNNILTLGGTDASFFEIIGTELFIKAGTVLDFETKSSYSISVNVDDATIGGTPDATVSYTLTVTDVVIETPPGVTLIVSEVAPWSSGNSPVGADWFELTNTGTNPVTIAGWKMDDNSNSFASSVALNGITTIAPGETVIFIESAAPATIVPLFLSTWFGANPPAGLQVGTYTGSGVGLSTGGDAVNIFNGNGELQAKVLFGTSPAGPSFPTFNNAIGLNNTTISTFSVVGVNDAFAAVNDLNEIGSPGTIGKLYITEVAPWSSGNSPVGADWFEVTNTKATAVDITGWKMDDNSGSPAAAVALNGITSIAPGESVIFIESNAPATIVPLFLSTWFGANPPSGLQVGTYTGSGVGLGTGGDAVNLYNNVGVGVLQASVLFGASPTGTFRTFDNAAKLNSTTISQLSAVGVNGAFIARNDVNEIGSPGTLVTPPCPTITVTATQGAPILCNGGTTIVTVTVSGGTAPYTGTGTLTRTAGTYTFSVTDAYGCSGSATISISQPAQLVAAESHTAILCFGETSTVTISATGGTAPYTGTGTFTQAAGTQSYNVTDANGCTSLVSVTVTEPSQLVASESHTSIFCFGETSTVTISATGGTAPYTGTGTFTQAAGTQSYTVTDANGCTSTVSGTVTEPTQLVTAESHTAILCFGGTSTVTISATGGTAPYTGTGTFTQSAGTQSYTVTDANGCTSTVSVTVTEPTQLVAAESHTAILCFGGSSTVTISATGGTAAYTGTGTFIQTAGTQAYTVSDANGCISTVTVTLTEPTGITLLATSTNITCNGANNGSASVSVSGGTGTYTYLWTNNEGTATIISSRDNSIYQQNTGNSSGAGDLLLAGKNMTGVNSRSLMYFNIEGSIPSGSVITNANLRLQMMTSNPGTTVKDFYLHKLNQDWGEGTSVPTNPGLGIAATTNDATWLKNFFPGSDWTTAGGAFNASSSATISASTAGIYNWTSAGMKTDVQGWLDTPTSNFGWLVKQDETGAQKAAGFGSRENAASASHPLLTLNYATAVGTGSSVSNLAPGTYKVIVTDANGCIKETSVTIAEPAELVAAESHTTILCNGGTSTVTINATGGTAPYTGTGTFTQSVGTQSYTVTDANGCTSSVSVTVTQPDQLTITASAPPILCFGGSTIVTLVASGGTAPYTYSSGTPTPTRFAGTYTYVVTDANGCTASTVLTITQPAQLIAIASTTPVACFGGSSTVTVSATGGTAPYTGTGTFTQSAGTQSYTVTDANGCTSTVSVSVIQPTQLTASATSTPVSTIGGTDGTATVTASGGTPPYTYLWSPGGQTTATATGLTAGTYTVRATDANGCTATASATVGSPACNITLSFTQTNVLCFGGSTGTATVTAANTTGTVTYLWSNGQTTQTAIGLAAGTYSVTVTDGAGCSATGSIIITQPASALIASSAASIIACNGGSATVTVSATGGTAPYTGTGTFSRTAGTYTFTVTDANGCTAATSVTIIQPTALAATATSTDATSGSNGTATANPTGGTAPYTYLWSPGGQTTATATGLAAGTYTVTVTDSRGCTATATATVVSNGCILAVNAGPDKVICNNASSVTLAASVTGVSTGTAPATPFTELPTTTTDMKFFSGKIDYIAIGNTFSKSEDRNNCGQNATSAKTLTIPAGAIVKKAYLYWSGSGNLDNQVKLNGTSVTADGTKTYNVSGVGSFFGARKDVTSMVTASGTYTVSELTWSNASSYCQWNGAYGAWGMVVVYELSSLPSARIHLNTEKFQMTYPTGNYSTTIPGISVPLGCSSNAKFTIIAFEGDNYKGEGLTIGGQSFGDNNFRGQSGPNLDILSWNIPTLVTSSTSSLTYTINAYQSNTVFGLATEALFDYVKVLKYNNCPANTCNVAYQWKKNGITVGTTQSISVSTAGTYEVTATDCAGCIGTDQAVVTASTLSATATAGSINCYGGTTNVTVTATGGTAPYTGTGTFSKTAGTYSFTVTDAAGCTKVTSVTVTQPTPLVMTATAPVIPCGSTTTTVTVSATGGTAPYSGVATFVRAAGTYTFTVSDSKGCTGTKTITIASPVCGPVDPNKCYKLIARHSGKALSIENCSSNNDKQAEQQTSSNCMIWKFVQVQTGYYQIINVNSGKSLRVKDGKLDNNEEIVQRTYAGMDYEKWSITANGAYFVIKAKHSGKAMSVKDASTSNGADVVQKGTGSNTNEQWSLVEVTCPVATRGLEPIITKGETLPSELEVTVLPNPSATNFTLNVKSNDKESAVTVRVMDANGKMISVHPKVGLNNALRIGGEKWAGGIYFAEVTQGGQRKVVKMIKIN